MTFSPGTTCIILDEIQECPEARTSLKFFKEDGRFDVIATGSLLGVRGYGDARKKSRRRKTSVKESGVNSVTVGSEDFLARLVRKIPGTVCPFRGFVCSALRWLVCFGKLSNLSNHRLSDRCL